MGGDPPHDRDHGRPPLRSAGPDDPTLPRSGESAQYGLPSRRLEPGEMVGEFRIVRVLGAGGMGTVYEAEQQNPRRRVALKVVRGGAAIDEADLRMFAREIESLARLKHPNIATIYSSGRTDEGQQYFAMELVTGSTLDAHFRAHGGWDRLEPGEIERRLRLLITLCRAVGYAHQRGVIHRDLKPGNVMVTEDAPSSTDSMASSSSVHGPVVKVLDFGLARITDSDVHATRATEISSVLGTLAYMSPEQASGRVADLDLRTDVYSLGVLLYEALTGRRPMELADVSFVEALRRLTHEAPRPLGAAWQARKSLDPDLATIVMKALASDPVERYESAIALADDLDRYLAGQPILARPASGLYQLKKLAARHRGAVVAGVAGLLVLIGFAVTMTVQARRIAEERDRAEAEAARAEANSRFLHEAIGAADPWGGGGVDITIREVLDDATLQLDKTFAGQPLLRAEALGIIAVTEGSLGRVDRAESLSAVAASIRMNEMNQTGVALAKALYDAGYYAWLNGRAAAADSLLLRALDEAGRARRDPREEAQVDTLEFTILSAYGHNLSSLGRYAAADSVADILEELAPRLDTPGRARQATAYNLRASIATALANHALSDSVTRLEYEILVRLHGPGHPRSLTALNNLALSRGFLGDAAGAESLFIALIADLEEVLGPEHPMLARATENLGNVYFQNGRFDEAAALLERVLTIRRNGLGPDHATVYRTIANMGSVHRRIGNSARAIELFSTALEGFERQMGPDHPELATILSSRGLEYEVVGQYSMAEQDFRRALDIRRHNFPEDHPFTALSRIYYGLLLHRINRDTEADSLLERGIAVREKTAPPEDALLTRARAALAKRRGG
jgi:serine/threonine protein kinase